MSVTFPAAAACCSAAWPGLYMAADRIGAAIDYVHRADPHRADPTLDDLRTLLAGARRSADHASAVLDRARLLLLDPGRGGPRLPAWVGQPWPSRHLDQDWL